MKVTEEFLSIYPGTMVLQNSNMKLLIVNGVSILSPPTITAQAVLFIFPTTKGLKDARTKYSG